MKCDCSLAHEHLKPKKKSCTGWWLHIKRNCNMHRRRKGSECLFAVVKSASPLVVFLDKVYELKNRLEKKGFNRQRTKHQWNQNQRKILRRNQRKNHAIVESTFRNNVCEKCLWFIKLIELPNVSELKILCIRHFSVITFAVWLRAKQKSRWWTVKRSRTISSLLYDRVHLVERERAENLWNLWRIRVVCGVYCRDYLGVQVYEMTKCHSVKIEIVSEWFFLISKETLVHKEKTIS